MLKVNQADLNRFESEYPGIRAEIICFEAAILPRCRRCDSPNTAIVDVGIIARTMTVAAATSKYRLVPKEPRPGKFYCGDCKQYFDAGLGVH